MSSSSYPVAPSVANDKIVCEFIFEMLFMQYACFNECQTHVWMTPSFWVNQQSRCAEKKEIYNIITIDSQQEKNIRKKMSAYPRHERNCLIVTSQ